MGVSRYKGNRWRAQVYDGPGKMRHVGIFDKKADANAALAVAVAEGNRVGGSMTVAEWREVWVAQMWSEVGTKTQRRRESTVQGYDEATRAFAIAHGRLKLRDVRKSLGLEWTRAHQCHQNALRCMFADAELADQLEMGKNPFANLRVPGYRGRRDLPSGFLTPAKLDDLMNAGMSVHGETVGRMFAAFVVVACETGMRRGELFALRRTDVDLENGVIVVSRAYSQRLGTIGLPKNGRAAPVVLGQRSREVLAQVMKHPLHRELVFTSKTGKPLTGGSFHSLLNPVRHLAGLPDLTAHWFRHYAATFLVESGMSYYDVAQQLRHSDGGKLVESTYSHRDNHAALERIRAGLDADPETHAEDACTDHAQHSLRAAA